METKLSQANMEFLNKYSNSQKTIVQEQTEEQESKKDKSKMLTFAGLALAAIGAAGIGLCLYKKRQANNPINLIVSRSNEFKENAAKLLEEAKEISEKGKKIMNEGLQLKDTSPAETIVQKDSSGQNELTYLFDKGRNYLDGVLVKNADGTQDMYIYNDTELTFTFLKNCSGENVQKIMNGDYKADQKFVFGPSGTIERISDNVISENYGNNLSSDFYYAFTSCENPKLRFVQVNYSSIPINGSHADEKFSYNNGVITRYEDRCEYVEFDESGKVKE